MKLFVGSLPYEFTDGDLQELFESVGKVVSAKVIMDRETGRSRGFGFVEMSSESEGNEAIEQLAGKKVNGRTIVVNRAHKSERAHH